MTIYKQGEPSEDATDTEKQRNLCSVVELAQNSKIIITRKDIAEFTGYSPKTVDDYIDNFSAKAKACGYQTKKQRDRALKDEVRGEMIPVIASPEVSGQVREVLDFASQAKAKLKSEPESEAYTKLEEIANLLTEMRGGMVPYDDYQSLNEDYRKELELSKSLTSEVTIAERKLGEYQAAIAGFGAGLAALKTLGILSEEKCGEVYYCLESHINLPKLPNKDTREDDEEIKKDDSETQDGSQDSKKDKQ